MRMRLFVPVFAFAAAIALLPASAPAQPKDKGEAWKTAVDKATAYLKKTQNEDGSWGTPQNSTGVTGIVATGLLQCGAKPEDEPAAKGVKYIEGLVNEKSGHIAGKDANP